MTRGASRGSVVEMRLGIPVLFIGAACAACSDPAAPREPLVLSPSTLALVAGDTARLTATNTRSAVNWRSESPATATVDGSGLVTGVAPGVVRIWARRSVDSAAASVMVTPRMCVLIASISPNNTVLSVGEAARAEAQLGGCSTIDRGANWTSRDTTVATVASLGIVQGKAVAVITAHKAGQVVVTASSMDDPAISVTMAVRVR